MLSRAKRADFTVLPVTLNLWALSWRPMDLDNAYVPFLPGIGNEVGFSDPAFQAKHKKDSGNEIDDDITAGSMVWENTIFTGAAHTWDELDFLKRNWDGPIVLKGIQSVEDAKKAVASGAQGIIVLNHGGRLYDGAVGSLDILTETADAVGDKITILFDSGIRFGADIMKAMALGAKAVLVGRPIIYGLSVAGQRDASHAMKCILADLDRNIGLCALKGTHELTRDILRRDDGFMPHPAAST